MFYHPKYYKELRKRNNSDQVISPRVATASARRALGPGLRGQAKVLKQQGSGSSNKQQADKAQATETQASSSKR